jgi:TolB-like protein/DNA-binding winged helix-turn-helix (wHTH) protein/Tfp pilus assembly protein PilF
MASYALKFGEFELDPTAYELRRLGQPVRLERIPMELLLLLVSRRGELVTRAEIVDKLWGSEVFIDTNTAVNIAVSKARQALRDDPDNPRYLLTISGKGYRFIGLLEQPPPARPAESPQVQPSPSAQVLIAPPEPAETIELPSRPRRRWLLLAFAGGVVAVAVFLLWPRFRLTPPAASKKTMLVVLPFENLSGDPGQEYIADGMTEEMITQLGSLEPHRLGVIARTSSMQYKTSKQNAAQIARELGVSYLLEGSIRRSGDQIRVSAQLIQASDQTHVWAEDYDRDLSNLLEVESDIAVAIAGHIQLALPPQTLERISAKHPVNAEAQVAYLLGLQALNQRTREGFTNAIAEFQRAITIDPNYALPYAGLARSYALSPIMGGAKLAEVMPKARAAASRAIALDSALADAHAVLAMVAGHYDYDWDTAEREFRRALELNPSSADAHFFYSNSYLSPFGHHDEAIAELQRAMELDPLSLPIQAFLGRTYVWARRYDDALAQFRKIGEMSPDLALNHERLSHLYAYLNRYDEAIEEDAKARTLSGDNVDSVFAKKDALRRAFVEHGPRGFWQGLLELSKAPQNPPEAYTDHWGVAIIYAQLGDKNKALDALEEAYSERNFMLTEIAVEPALDPLRSEPRFKALLQRVGLGQRR